jgi:hypothetical protein
MTFLGCLSAYSQPPKKYLRKQKKIQNGPYALSSFKKSENTNNVRCFSFPFLSSCWLLVFCCQFQKNGVWDWEHRVHVWKKSAIPLVSPSCGGGISIGLFSSRFLFDGRETSTFWQLWQIFLSSSLELQRHYSWVCRTLLQTDPENQQTSMWVCTILCVDGSASNTTNSLRIPGLTWNLFPTWQTHVCQSGRSPFTRVQCFGVRTSSSAIPSNPSRWYLSTVRIVKTIS